MSVDFGTMFMVAFLSVWLTGWTIGGVFASGAMTGGGVGSGAFCVWLVLACTFGFNCVALGNEHPSTIVWFVSWILFGRLLAYIRSFGPLRFRNAVHAAVDDIAERIDSLVLRVRYLAASCTRRKHADADSFSFPLTMISVSVHRPSGETVLSNVDLLSHTHVRALVELCEAHLGLRRSEKRCQLVFDNNVLAASARLCDVGVKEGSDVTVVVAQEVTEAPESQQTLGVGTTPFPVRCFLCLWLCGWCFGEIFVASILERTLLGISSAVLTN